MSTDSDFKDEWNKLTGKKIDPERVNLMKAESSGAVMLEEIKSRGSVMENPDMDGENKRGHARPLKDQYTWDVVFVFNVGNESDKMSVLDEEKGEVVKLPQTEVFRDSVAETVLKLESARLYTDMWKSVQGDEIYVRVAASEKRLQEEADRVDYDLQLDEERCLEAGKVLDIRLAQVSEDPKYKTVGRTAWDNLYGKFDQLDPEHIYRQELYKRFTDSTGFRPNSFFRSIDRIKLTVNIIEADEELGGAGISMSKAIANDQNAMIAFFPLHEQEVKEKLMAKWFKWRSAFRNPLEDIRNYFGEQVALYFAFLAFYNRTLIPISIFGTIIFIWQMSVGRIDVEILPVFAVFVALWATIFLEMWKRHEARFRVQWGMTKFQEKEQPRPEFWGSWEPSPIDGHKIEVFPWLTKIKRALFSQTIIWLLIGVVIASVVSIFLFRKIVVDWNPDIGPYLIGFINAIQIQTLNVIYGIVAFKLNDYENHRTDTEYQNALIAKTFLFKFVNSYNSLFYIAFFKKHDDAAKKNPSDKSGCTNDDCLTELAQQLGTIFITSILVNNFLEVGIPYLKNMYTARANEAVDDSAAEKKKSKPEEEYELTTYEGTFDDFDEMVIQYGYVTLFVVAFPAAPLAALLNNILETRVDSTKLCMLTRRPEPRGAYDIGTWSDILNIVSIIAVMVNVAIISFETELVKGWVNHDSAAQAYVFILSEHIILLLKFTVAYFVPDEPLDVTDHKARQEYIVNVLINGMEDEGDDEEEMANKGPSLKKLNFPWEERLSDSIRFTGREL